MKQVAFEGASYWHHRKQKFLTQMDVALSWEEILTLSRQFYYKGEKGRPPILLAVRIFVRLDTGSVPDEPTRCKFRHLLERHGLTQRLFALSRDWLEQHGLMVKAGTIVDATIISAPSSTKNQASPRDPELQSTKKGLRGLLGGRRLSVPIRAVWCIASRERTRHRRDGGVFARMRKK